MSTCTIQLPQDFNKRYKAYRDELLIKQGVKEPPFNWTRLSPDNLDIARRVIKVTTNFLELAEPNVFLGQYKIPLKKFEDEKVYYDDVAGILGRIEGLKVKNDDLSYQRIEQLRNRVVVPGIVHDDFLDFFPSEKSLDEYVFVWVSSSEELYEARSTIESLVSPKVLHIETSVATDGVLPASAPLFEEGMPQSFVITTKDREIWVNDFLLSKPHAVGANKGFFDYIYENAGSRIERGLMPDYAKEGIKGDKGFTKVINELGFKGEILKAFCPERSKTKILLRKEISAEQLKRERINIELLLQELRTAHVKNSPT